MVPGRRIWQTLSEQTSLETNMARPRKASTSLPPELARHRKIPVRVASDIVDVHEDTFRKHYGHLIKKVGPRLDRVDLADVLSIGKST
jgi:hypothetical protein